MRSLPYFRRGRYRRWRPPRVLPRFASTDREHARLTHRDIPHLPRPRIWAELHVVEAELARRLYRRLRPRVLIGGPDVVVTDQAWLTERLRRLRAALKYEARP